MLYNELEEHLMQRAIQPNMRNKKTRVEPFQAILTDFFQQTNLQGSVVLDIGPGQCDFLDLAKGQGAVTYGVDFDMAVVELGTLRGHRMTHVNNIQGEWPYESAMFDGIFCRGSLNYFFKPEVPQAAGACLERIFSSAKPGAWIWIAPFPKPGANWSDARINDVSRMVTDILDKYHTISRIPDEQSRTRYGIGYIVPFPQLWTRFPQHMTEDDLC